MATKEPLLKVLVIHGYRQSTKSSREKTGSFRKGLKKYLDLVYITAPNEIPGSSDEAKEYGWWFSKKEEQLSFNAKEASNIDNGHEDSLKLIRKTFEEQGPFDGILGFSQGATMAAHICTLCNKEDNVLKLSFAILCAGFVSRSSLHEKYYEDKIDIPTLHVFGDTDQVIPCEMSIELMNHFSDSATLKHNGGHYLPATSAEKKQYQAFLERFRNK